MTLLPDFWGIGVHQQQNPNACLATNLHETDLPLDLGLPEQTGFKADTVAAGPQ